MAEKSEKATPKKLRDARKKGQVAKSQDFPSALTFVVSIIGTLLSAGYLYQNLSSYTIQTFRAIRGNLDLTTQASSYLAEAMQVIMICSFPIVIIVSFVGVLVNFLVVGPLFSFEAMKFSWKKLNPIEGIKQKFKLKVLVDLLKSILKIIGAAVIIFFVIWNTLPEVVGSVRMPVYASALLLELFLRKITIQVGIFFLAIAIFDLAFQKRTFAKEMMMEKFEVKQEYKDTEGDPHIKGRRREIFREIAYTEGPGAAKRAKVIVTNPTHLAIAIGYSEETKEVPTILTMGQRSIAEKILEIAIREHVPIMRNVELAHELFNKGKIGDYIPEETYKAVAEILKWIATLEEKPSFAEELLR
jgi:type III secretion protein U